MFKLGRSKVRKAGEMLEALRSDFGAGTDSLTAWSTGTDSAGTAGTLPPGQQDGWTLKLLGLQGETKVVCNLPCQITFGHLHEKIREVTGAKEQGCDVKLMLNGTVLQHSRATVLSDMSRCNGMELTYLVQTLGFASQKLPFFPLVHPVHPTEISEMGNLVRMYSQTTYVCIYIYMLYS